MPQHPLLKRIEDHLNRTGLSASRFGRQAVGDPSIVFDLRAGRQPRPTLERRLVAWLESGTGEGEVSPCRPA